MAPAAHDCPRRDRHHDRAACLSADRDRRASARLLCRLAATRDGCGHDRMVPARVPGRPHPDQTIHRIDRIDSARALSLEPEPDVSRFGPPRRRRRDSSREPCLPGRRHRLLRDPAGGFHPPRGAAAGRNFRRPISKLPTLGQAVALACNWLGRPDIKRMNPREPRSLRPLLLAVVLAMVVWSSWRHVSGHMSIEGMRTLVNSHARYGPLVFMAMVVVVIFTRLPMAGTLLIAMGAVLFGPFRAFAYGWAAALVGTTSTFLLVRYVARDYLQSVFYGFSTRLRALDDRLTRNGF